MVQIHLIMLVSGLCYLFGGNMVSFFFLFDNYSHSVGFELTISSFTLLLQGKWVLFELKLIGLVKTWFYICHMSKLKCLKEINREHLGGSQNTSPLFLDYVLPF